MPAEQMKIFGQQRSESHGRRIPTHSVQAQVTSPSLSLYGRSLLHPPSSWTKETQWKFYWCRARTSSGVLALYPSLFFSLSLSLSLPPTLYLSFTVVVRIFTWNENWNSCYSMRGGDRGRGTNRADRGNLSSLDHSRHIKVSPFICIFVSVVVL